MDARELMGSANDRIRDVRSADFTLTFVDEKGAPVRNAEVDVTLVNHAFRFGCNGFLVHSSPDPSLEDAYGARFTALLNYATLPFYWGGYERVPGETRESHLHKMSGWCKQHSTATKGHPLIWHEVFPQWANALPDEEVLTRLETRARTIPAQFRGEVDIWDVVNEATVSPSYDNAVGRWVARNGAVDAVEAALRWARAGNPEATLIYNDFNLSQAFESLVAELLDRGAPLDAIGVQSHMHQGVWPLQKAWHVCQTYGRFGLPLHFTELTILSGDLKNNDDNDWHTRRPAWLSTPEAEAAQAEIGVQLYTLLFSHPAVEAITWWDFSDLGAWMGAPAGLLRANMSPKPLYERLIALIRGEWCTNVQTDTGDHGVIRCRCFFGTHQVTARLPSGDVVSAKFQAECSGDRAISIALPIPNAG